jgi:ABC-type lipoprotein release transport system permease subunit
LQLRVASYEDEKLSLKWEDLLENPETLTAEAEALDEVVAAAPVLWASGVLNTRDDSVGLQMYGIDPTSALYAPFQNAMIEGEFLSPDDRSGVLIGKRLADSLDIGVGDNVNLVVVNADGEPDESTFTIRGLYSTGIFKYDDASALMPLSKAQAFTGTDGRASAIVMLLRKQDDAVAVATKLQVSDLVVKTWEDLNAVFLQTMDTALSFYIIIYLIVILIVAVIIANTLLMSVYERIREMGIMAALGMKGGQILLMYLFEATLLGLAGIVVGLVLGSLAVWYLATVGLHIGDIGAAAGDIPMGSTLYGKFNPSGMVGLSFWTLFITLLAALYPAWFASRLQPVEALHSQ